MTTQKKERPAELKRVPKVASKPKPAHDETHDPADLPKPAAEQAPARRSKQEVTVQMAVRVSPDVAELLENAALERGVYKRQIIEDLIRTHLG